MVMGMLYLNVEEFEPIESVSLIDFFSQISFFTQWDYKKSRNKYTL